MPVSSVRSGAGAVPPTDPARTHASGDAPKLDAAATDGAQLDPARAPDGDRLERSAKPFGLAALLSVRSTVRKVALVSVAAATLGAAILGVTLGSSHPHGPGAPLQPAPRDTISVVHVTDTPTPDAKPGVGAGTLRPVPRPDGSITLTAPRSLGVPSGALSHRTDTLTPDPKPTTGAHPDGAATTSPGPSAGQPSGGASNPLRPARR